MTFVSLFHTISATASLLGSSVFFVNTRCLHFTRDTHTVEVIRSLSDNQQFPSWITWKQRDRNPLLAKCKELCHSIVYKFVALTVNFSWSTVFAANVVRQSNPIRQICVWHVFVRRLTSLKASPNRQ